MFPGCGERRPKLRVWLRAAVVGGVLGFDWDHCDLAILGQQVDDVFGDVAIIVSVPYRFLPALRWEKAPLGLFD